MLDESKMYVVIGVLLIILFGIFIYLVSIDLKLRRLENKYRDHASSEDSLPFENKNTAK